jgi:hypothetical protein
MREIQYLVKSILVRETETIRENWPQCKLVYLKCNMNLPGSEPGCHGEKLVIITWPMAWPHCFHSGAEGSHIHRTAVARVAPHNITHRLGSLNTKSVLKHLTNTAH